MIQLNNKARGIQEPEAAFEHIFAARQHAKQLLPLCGVILCGGKSKRMGRNKAFLPYAGKTLIEHSLDLMSEVFQDVLLVSNNPEDFEHLSANSLKDIIPNRGPLVGILSGLLVSNYEHIFVMPCDMPFVDKSLMRQISAQRHKAEILLYRHEQKNEALLGLYSKACIEALEEAIFAGEDRVEAFLAANNPDYFDYQSEKKNFALPHFSIDTPSDYGQLCALHK
ncbi:MAG: molybdenum cofactor guanylyltransferase [Candidatus Obscuribacterales bacterium]|nr:molybdenum cofactor guanylyltransferase [Candidatus Obscuribacterales bacterium]